MKISAITDYTETFCNCNGVSTDTKQAATPNAVEKVNINKKLPAFVCANLFLICVENKLAPHYRQKVLKIILTARQNMKISAITDETETFGNCNNVSTDTKQTTTPNAVEKVHRCGAFQICQVRKRQNCCVRRVSDGTKNCVSHKKGRLQMQTPQFCYFSDENACKALSNTFTQSSASSPSTFSSS